MMQPVHRIDATQANPNKGEVVFRWDKALWNLGMLLAAIILIPFHTNSSAIALFFVLTYFSLLIGHSAGMHRMMIHKSFKAKSWVEKFLIYIGVLVGMSGPHGVIRIHDLRDWAQRQSACHDFFAHRRSYWQDIWWQLTCDFKFTHPPKITIEPEFDTHFYRWLESTWRIHQLGLAFILYFLGDWPFIVWGVFARVAVSVTGHWTITYFCHNPGPGNWRVKDATVQASNTVSYTHLTLPTIA